MAKNQSTYTLRIDTELGNLQQVLSKAQSSLQQFMATGQTSKGLEKTFEKVKELLGQIQDKVGKPLDLKGLTGIGKNLENVEENFRTIIRLLGDFDQLSDEIKFSFLEEKDKKKIEAITAALKKYQDTLTSVAERQKQLETAKKTKGKNAEAVTKARKKTLDLTDKKSAAESKRDTKKGQLEALQGLGDKADPVRIAKLSGEIGELETEIAQLGRALGEAQTELRSAESAFSDSGAAVERFEKGIKKANGEELKELKKQARELGVSLEGLNGHNAEKQMEILTARMSEFKREITNGAQPAFEAIKRGCTEAEATVRDLGEEVQGTTEIVKAADEAAAQREAFEGRIKQFLGLQGAAHVLRKSLQNAISTVTELDETMTEMAVVTDLTVGDYWDQLPEYAKQASELGVSINSAYEAATLYYQQGLKGNEVTKISAETLKLARIAGLDAADATNKMTAALRGFNMELNETSAQRISDVYSKLAAITAADVGEISSAMTKTASIASNAGMEFETTAAFLSQIIETTRESAETAGTAMKTIVARFQELKKDPSEIGEVDGEIVDANKIETALRSVGVALRDSNGQFRELDDVFMELSSKWDGLDKNTQRYIATIAAGSRQQSRFIAMMSNYSRTQELVAAANNSAGASQEQFEKTLDGVRAKLTNLKTAWEEFSMGIMDSTTIKMGIELMTKFLEVINKATSGFNGVAGSLTKISTVLAVFKVGKSLFAQIPKRFKEAMVEVIQEAISGGEKAAEGASEGAKKKASELTGQAKNNELAEPGSATLGSMMKTGTKALGSSFLKSTGVANFQESYKKRQQVQGYRKAQESLKNNTKEERTSQLTTRKTQLEQQIAEGVLDEKALKKAKKEIKGIDSELQGFSMTAQDAYEAQAAVWDNISSGVQKAGDTITNTGVAFSMFGGILSEMGLEEAGETITKIGNGITLAGSAVSLLGPMVTKLVSILVDGGMKTQAAWGWVSIAMLAIAGIITAITLISESMNENSAEAKLERAKEAAEEAKEAAEKTAEAYKNLFSGFKSYNNSQDKLDSLTVGTREWKEALLEANSQVKDLIEQYPALAKYVTLQNGRLIISEEGYDAVLKEQEQAYNSSQLGAVTQSKSVSFDTVKLSFEASDIYEELASRDELLVSYQDEKGEWWNNNLYGEHVDRLLSMLISGYTEDGLDLTKAGWTQVEIGGVNRWAKNGLALEEEYLLEIIEVLKENHETVLQLANNDQERLWLQSLITDANFREETTDAFSKQFGGEQSYRNQVNKISNDINTELSQSSADIKDENGTLSKIIDEHKLGDRRDEILDTDANKALVNLYEALGGDKKNTQGKTMAELSKMVAEQSMLVKTQNNLISYLEKLNDKIYKNEDGTINKTGASNLAGLFSTQGAGLTYEKASELKNLTYNNDALGAYVAKELDVADFVQASSLFGLSEDRLLEIIKSSIEDAYSKKGKVQTTLREVLDKPDDPVKVRSFTNNIELDAKTQQNLADKFVGMMESFSLGDNYESLLNGDYLPQEIKNAINKNDINLAIGNSLFTLLQDFLNDATAQGEPQLNAAASYLGQMNWYDKSSWESLGENLQNLGVQLTGDLKDSFEKFTMSAQEAAQAVYLIDFSKLKAEVAGINEVLRELEQNSFKRFFDEESYNTLISNNKNLQNSFVQLGDQFIYLGESVSLLSASISKAANTKINAGLEQIQAKKAVAELLEGTVFSSDLYAERAGEFEEALSTFLSQVPTKIEQGAPKNILSYLSGSGIDFYNLDLSTITDEKLLQIAQYLNSVIKEAGQLTDQYSGLMIQSYVLQNSEATNLNKGAQLRETNYEESKLYSKAFASQAILSNLVSEQVISDYIKELNSSSPDYEKLADYEAKILKSINEGVKNSEDIKNKVDLQNQVADALYTLGEKEIEEMSSLYQTINSANEQIASKIEEQIQERRTERQLEEQKQGLEDLYSKQAFLSMDPSNQLSLQALDQEIAQTEEQYQDALLDQALQNLQDANQKAVEQRDRQISIMTESLESSLKSGELMSQAVAITRESLDAVNSGALFSGTSAGLLIAAAQEWSRKSFEDLQLEEQALQQIAVSAANADIKQDVDEIGDVIGTGGQTETGINDTANNIYLELKDINGKLDAVKILSAVTGMSEDAIKTLQEAGSDLGTVVTTIGDGLESLGEGLGSAVTGITNYLKEKGIHFKTGGLASFTGPAWLDGTPSHPEYVLNAAQTERFFSLVDVLENYKGKTGEALSGDNYFEIEINVEKLENDYDVEQVADKIRSMIYEDASYRNTNAINHIR